MEYECFQLQGRKCSNGWGKVSGTTVTYGNSNWR